jgi:lysophospholipase L1-like esterase
VRAAGTASLLGALITGLLAVAGPAGAQAAYEPSPPPEPGIGICPGGVCQAEGLRTFFEALAGTEAGRRNRPVHILQIGDSHTAGDRITGKLRVELQRRFGRAGRGVLPPGVPYDGYAPMQVQVGSVGWATEQAPLQPPGGVPSPQVGLSGVRSTGAGEAVMGFVLDPGAEAMVIGVCGRALGPGPSLSVEFNGVGREMTFGETPACHEMALQRSTSNVRLLPLGDGFVIDAVRLERAGPGIVVSNLGRVGATLRDLASRDEAMARTELETWQPDLIVLAFGTNEGFDDALEPAAYEALLKGQVERMQRLAPAASLLILGAPDALRNGTTGGCSADGLRAPPPKLAVVRDVQRRVAADLGVAFWDWHGRMGGDCSADRLALRPEPLMRGDRVHFTSAGADWIGGVLAGDLTAAYEAWKAGREGAD